MGKLTNHKKCLPQDKIPTVNFALLITSDSRTPQTDQTGKTIINLLKQHHHQCLDYQIVKNNLIVIRREVKKYLKDPRIKLIITSGGTGCSQRDVTIEAIESLVVKKLIGFGELFRMLSYQEIGSAAFMSRAMLGVTKNGKIICSLPGSVNAVKLALSKLLIPELAHLIWEIQK